MSSQRAGLTDGRAERGANSTVTLLYGAKDEAINHAVVLVKYLAR